MGFRVDSDFDGGWILIFCYGFFFFFWIWMVGFFAMDFCFLDLDGWIFCYGFLFFGLWILMRLGFSMDWMVWFGLAWWLYGG